MNPSTKFLAAALLTLAAPLWAGTDTLNSETGMVQIFVEDASGRALPSVPVYISWGQKVQTVESDKTGTVSLTLPEGGYSISSSLTESHNDGIYRFASGEANIHVTSRDTASVVLVLHPLNDPVPDLTVTTLQKIGVADEVAKYLN